MSAEIDTLQSKGLVSMKSDDVKKQLTRLFSQNTEHATQQKPSSKPPPPTTPKPPGYRSQAKQRKEVPSQPASAGSLLPPPPISTVAPVPPPMIASKSASSSSVSHADIVAADVSVSAAAWMMETAEVVAGAEEGREASEQSRDREKEEEEAGEKEKEAEDAEEAEEAKKEAEEEAEEGAEEAEEEAEEAEEEALMQEVEKEAVGNDGREVATEIVLETTTDTLIRSYRYEVIALKEKIRLLEDRIRRMEKEFNLQVSEDSGFGGESLSPSSQAEVHVDMPKESSSSRSISSKKEQSKPRGGKRKERQDALLGDTSHSASKKEGGVISVFKLERKKVKERTEDR